MYRVQSGHAHVDLPSLETYANTALEQEPFDLSKPTPTLASALFFLFFSKTSVSTEAKLYTLRWQSINPLLFSFFITHGRQTL